MVTTITLNKVEKRFGALDVIRGIDLEIKPGAFTVFVGPSGCGKSTLLRMIAGLETISGGDLLIDGDRMNDVAASKRGIAMVFQSYALYPHMSVYKNLAFGLETAGYKREEIDRRVREAAATLQITDYLQRKPKALSGGQRQRVAIGRSIVRDPKIFLFDEPLSNLDAELRVQMRVEITKLHERLGNTMIYVTHDQVEAMTMADQIVVLKAGKVMQAGSPLELYNNPANQFVAGFIGSPKMNFVAVEAADGTAVTLNGVRIETGRQHASGKLTLGIRPEHIDIGDGPGQVIGEARVELVEHLGGSTVLHVLPPFQEETMTVMLSGQQPCRSGDRVALRIERKNCHLFDTEGRALLR
ncbi:multiple sugar transport system ATP-binding protein [Neorhizobium huautlense]|uniref:Multiple sugar transport system ATP-binding protein n=1 Tax=Neorhizobium huautlense TaxID=67774 RepID=A0ABT9PS32_9HYPH|nr:ABC transporter ATP-binding protein [Neorhizobium huautlense]MDP9837267.1 multiple sugar transport system ATP-binding protein [Neorhizobium huautlense]